MNTITPHRLKTGVLLLVLLLIGSFAFGQTTVTYNFSDSGAVAGLNEASPGIAVDANIGFGSFKNGGTSDPTILSGQLRLYQNATKGGSIRIYANNGVTITKVVVYASGSSGTGPAGYNVDNGAGTNISISGGAYTMNSLTATSRVEFYSRGNSNSTRVYVDRFEVTYTTSGGNTGPDISNIVQAPAVGNVDPNDTVLVTADVADPDGIASVKLYWGTASGNLPNEIPMVDMGSSQYGTDPYIPAQADGTTLYYHIVATDNNASDPLSTTSPEQSYTSVNPKPVISNIELLTNSGYFYSTDYVFVYADVTDADGIDTVELNWGLTSGSLNNVLPMSNGGSGDNYSNIDEIPAQPDGTTIYYSITATDTRSGSTTTTERSYTVQDPAPTISEITQTPSASAVTNTDPVSVSADITDDDQVVSAELQWGTASGVYPNTINMTFVAGDNYKTFEDIPAQIAGTTVYYVIKATNNFPTTTTSAEHSYVVSNPRPDISNIVQVPDNASVTSADGVSVSADVIDNDGIASVILRWGTATGVLPNTINMTFQSGDTYSTVSDIPAQADGVTVYYEIEATDTNPTSPATRTSAEQSYTVHDPLVFRIPYINDLRIQTDVDDAEEVGFTFTDTGLETGGGGYVRIDEDGTIVSPEIDFSAYDNLTVAFSARTYGGSTGQELTVWVLNDDGITYDLVATHPITGSYTLYENTIDLSTYNSDTGRIKFEMTAGTNSIRFRDLTIYDGYVYYNGTWKPSDISIDIQDSDANIYIKNGTASLNNATVKNITVDAGSKLEIKRVLLVNGNVTNNGEIIFLSTADRTGELGPVAENSHFLGDGIVTFHRYMSDHRAFRMVSSSVNTIASIHDNWQEGATSATDNPHPGFGTHITGVRPEDPDQTNGFDKTILGNPSMFTVDIPNQVFVPVPNTDVDHLVAGKPYLLYVRGDRSIDLTDNNAQGSTTLRASGELAHGVSLQSFNTTTAGQFIMFGNPYQSGVDINSVFANSTNINTNTYYIYDPKLADEGGYVEVDLSTGNNSKGSEANQYLQVGQAAQVATLATGMSSVVFHQTDKAPGNHTRTNATGNHMSAPNMLTVQLYTTERFNNGGSVHDGFAILFDDDNSNELTPVDAVKALNFYENLGVDHDGTYLGIERREMPQPNEVYQLYSTGFQHTDYTLKLIVEGLDATYLYLDDNFIGTSTLLEEGDNAYSFSVDKNNPLSIATDRFSIRTAERLGVDDNNLLSGIRLYPNPLNGDVFYINAPRLNGEELKVSIIDLSGRLIYEETLECRNNSVAVPMNSSIASGIYLVKLSLGGETNTLRLIKE